MKTLNQPLAVHNHFIVLVGLIAASMSVACGGGDSGGSGADTRTTSTGGSASDGSDGPLDACADPMPQSTCASGWICDSSQWVCRDDATGAGGSGSLDPTTDLDGQACSPGQQVTGECATCLCGESATFSCIYVPGCDVPDPDPRTDPKKTPDDYEGQPCTEGPYVQFDCATCYCADSAIYQCAYIADCGVNPFPPADVCDTPQPQEPCGTASASWICDQGQWTCSQLQL